MLGGISKRTVGIFVHNIGFIGLKGHYGSRENDYKDQAQITMIGLIQDGISYGYLNHNLSGVSITPLSKREAEVVDMLLDTGKTGFELVNALFISPKTLETHFYHIHEKLGTRNAYHIVSRVAYLRIHNMWPEPVENRGHKKS